MDVNEALKIAGDFHKSLETGDKNIIEKYSVVELKQALNKISPDDSYRQWYKEIEACIKELNQISEKNKSQPYEQKEKIELLIFGCLLGILGTLIAGWIKSFWK